MNDELRDFAIVGGVIGGTFVVRRLIRRFRAYRAALEGHALRWCHCPECGLPAEILRDEHHHDEDDNCVDILVTRCVLNHYRSTPAEQIVFDVLPEEGAR